ncbi:E3 ubiquitin-protein ligase RAD18-like [Cephus cinctus]|uniref:RING-type E3 ubiquitin transferase n=1 Tax=Cephus cinctus TaxID=211228 RepID=A0AAJ7FFP8_CEPCN|nr:E3 ubiquitin-protein ligase RAD18-like [Cephus cinctus]
MGKIVQITWPTEYIELKRIEDLLQCGICYEYIETSVMTPCSHNYCSLCIRKYLHYKTQCPTCCEQTYEKDLHTNRILDEVISNFLIIRENLARCVPGAIVQSIPNLITSSPPIRPARSNHSVRTPKKLHTDDGTVHENFTPNSNSKTPSMSTPKKSITSPGTSGMSKIASYFTPKSRKTVQPVDMVDIRKESSCPVCKVEVSSQHINKHLDACLKRDAMTDESRVSIKQKRKPLPKLVFNVMKDVELRKKMREYGLPSQGDRKTLETRFQRYSTLYNAECDKEVPRSVVELIKQCTEEEALEKKMQKAALTGNRLQVSRKADEQSNEEARKKYLDANKTNFQELIQNIKDRRNPKKPVRRSILPPSEKQDSVVTSIKKDPTEDDSSNAANESEESNLHYHLNHEEFAFQDNDSNTSCPLQWYTGDDPMRFVMTELNSDASPDKSSSCSKFQLNQLNSSPADEQHSPKVKTEGFADEDDSIVNGNIRNTNTSISQNTTNEIYVANPKSGSSSHSPEVVTTRDNIKSGKRITNKRVKLCSNDRVKSSSTNSVNTILKNRSILEQEQRKMESMNLAMSIAQDFLSDLSTSDSTDDESINLKTRRKSKERASSSTLQVPSKSGKENSKSSTDENCVVRRPTRKRNRISGLENGDTVNSTRIGVKSKKVLDEQNINQTKEVLEDDSEIVIDKNKSKSKKVTQKRAISTMNKSENPPKRPTRKCTNKT